MSKAGEITFEVYKHQREQLARLSQLSFDLVVALDDGEAEKIKVAKAALSRYMLIETNLAINYVKDNA